jgi:hypothetical protein
MITLEVISTIHLPVEVWPFIVLEITSSCEIYNSETVCKDRARIYSWSPSKIPKKIMKVLSK